MANTVTRSGNITTVTPDGSTDFDSLTEAKDINNAVQAAPKGILVNSIEFKMSAANDLLVVKEGSATGPILCALGGGLLGTNTIKYFNNSRLNLFMDNSDCTFGIAASAALIIHHN